MGFTEFLTVISGEPLLLISVLLTVGVIFVNGWTDAPNAIATCVATRAIAPRAAVLMSAVFNFAGVLVMTLINAEIADTISGMVDFGTGKEASAVLCAALFAIILWATVAWKFGIPTSESHALIAGLTGAAVALHNGFGGVDGGAWAKVGVGLVLSSVLGFGLGYLMTKLVALSFSRADRRKTTGFFRGAQIAGGAAMSFMHGAQDGQKFMGVIMVCVVINKGGALPAAEPWMMVLCSVVMALGTSLGGYKIIKSVGMDMVQLEPYSGFSADMAGAGCLLISSVFGIPVSTTHTKTAAIMGAGATKRLSAIRLDVVKDMVLTWVLTFPGCGLVGFLMAKLFMLF